DLFNDQGMTVLGFTKDTVKKWLWDKAGSAGNPTTNGDVIYHTFGWFFSQNLEQSNIGSTVAHNNPSTGIQYQGQNPSSSISKSIGIPQEAGSTSPVQLATDIAWHSGAIGGARSIAFKTGDGFSVVLAMNLAFDRYKLNGVSGYEL